MLCCGTDVEKKTEIKIDIKRSADFNQSDGRSVKETDEENSIKKSKSKSKKKGKDKSKSKNKAKKMKPLTEENDDYDNANLGGKMIVMSSVDKFTVDGSDVKSLEETYDKTQKRIKGSKSKVKSSKPPKSGTEEVSEFKANNLASTNKKIEKPNYKENKVFSKVSQEGKGKGSGEEKKPHPNRNNINFNDEQANPTSANVLSSADDGADHKQDKVKKSKAGRSKSKKKKATEDQNDQANNTQERFYNNEYLVQEKGNIGSTKNKPDNDTNTENKEAGRKKSKKKKTEIEKDIKASKDKYMSPNVQGKDRISSDGQVPNFDMLREFKASMVDASSNEDASEVGKSKDKTDRSNNEKYEIFDGDVVINACHNVAQIGGIRKNNQLAQDSMMTGSKMNMTKTNYYQGIFNNFGGFGLDNAYNKLSKKKIDVDYDSNTTYGKPSNAGTINNRAGKSIDHTDSTSNYNTLNKKIEASPDKRNIYSTGFMDQQENRNNNQGYRERASNIEDSLNKDHSSGFNYSLKERNIPSLKNNNFSNSPLEPREPIPKNEGYAKDRSRDNREAAYDSTDNTFNQSRNAFHSSNHKSKNSYENQNLVDAEYHRNNRVRNQKRMDNMFEYKERESDNSMKYNTRNPDEEGKYRTHQSQTNYEGSSQTMNQGNHTFRNLGNSHTKQIRTKVATNPYSNKSSRRNSGQKYQAHQSSNYHKPKYSGNDKNNRGDNIRIDENLNFAQLLNNNTGYDNANSNKNTAPLTKPHYNTKSQPFLQGNSGGVGNIVNTTQSSTSQTNSNKKGIHLYNHNSQNVFPGSSSGVGPFPQQHMSKKAKDGRSCNLCEKFYKETILNNKQINLAKCGGCLNEINLDSLEYYMKKYHQDLVKEQKKKLEKVIDKNMFSTNIKEEAAYKKANWIETEKAKNDKIIKERMKVRSKMESTNKKVPEVKISLN